MSEQTDDTFYDRADAHIELANAQCADAGQGKVSASFLYGAARFNTFIAAINAGSGEAMRTRRAEIIEQYTAEYRRMLEHHFSDYIENYDDYLK